MKNLFFFSGRYPMGKFPEGNIGIEMEERYNQVDHKHCPRSRYGIFDVKLPRGGSVIVEASNGVLDSGAKTLRLCFPEDIMDVITFEDLVYVTSKFFKCDGHHLHPRNEGTHTIITKF